MKTLYRYIFLLAFFCSFTSLKAQKKITAVQHPEKIDILIGNQFFTSYIYSDREKYPFFFPVNGPSNASVTSMRNGNYPHHSSLFFGCDKVNGGNYWQEGLDRGQIISLRTNILENEGEKVVLENENIWTRPDAMAPIKDYRTITITNPEAGIYQIDFEITMEMLIDVTIDKTNHSLFSARMDPDLAVIHGGTMINSEGQKGEKATFGQSSPWISYYGPRGEQVEGLTIMQHPSNRWYPAPWFTRDYGFISPTPMYWPENGENIKLPAGEKINLHYRVLVHKGDHQEAKIAEKFTDYQKMTIN